MTCLQLLLTKATCHLTSGSPDYPASHSALHWWGYQKDNLQGQGFQYLVDRKGYGPKERSSEPAKNIIDKTIINIINTQDIQALQEPGLWGVGGMGIGLMPKQLKLLYLHYAHLLFSAFECENL